MYGSKKRIAAFLLAVWMMAGSLPAVFAGDTDDVYAGTILAAIQTDPDSTYGTFMTDAEPVQPGAQAASETGKIDAVIDDLPEPLSAAEAAAKEAQLRTAQPQAQTEYRVGDVKRIISHYAQSRPGFTRRVDLVCTYIGERCTVWHEKGDETADTEYDETLADTMDIRIEKLHELFGDKRIDTDRDGKLAIFVYDIDNDDVGGYFTYFDLQDQYGRIEKVWYPPLPSSNHCDCIHVDNEYFSVGEVINTCVHEYQHYIEASYRYVGKKANEVSKAASTLINEGFSTAAELLVNGTDEYTEDFAYAARNTGTLSLFYWQSTYDSYCLAFAFSQYLRTRYAALTGDTDETYPGKAIYKTVLEKLSSVKKGDAVGIAADLLYPKEMYPQLADTDARVRQLIVDFWMAVLLKEPQGEHGFNGEKWAAAIRTEDLLQDLPAGEEKAHLRSGMAGFYRIGERGEVRVTESSRTITFAAIGSVGCTLRYDANGGRNAPPPQTMQYEYYVSGLHPLRSGYSFVGWAWTPDAQAEDAMYGTTVALTEDATLYAVWEPAQTVYADSVYPIDYAGTGTVTYSFTPQTDGFYDVIGNGEWWEPSTYLFRNEEEIPASYSRSSWDRTDYFYALTAGTTYDLVFRGRERDRSPYFQIQKQAVSYTLTCDWDVGDPAYDDQVVMQGTDTYIIRTPGYLDMPGAYVFLGWTEDPGDPDSPIYEDNDTIVLTRDVTLHALFRKPIALREGEAVTLTEKADEAEYTFTPQTDGTYLLCQSFEQSAEPDYEIVYLRRLMVRSDRDQTLFRESAEESGEMNPEIPLKLRAGATYRITVWSRSAVNSTVLIRKTSDDVATTLRLQTGASATPSLTLHGGAEYTLPDYMPAAVNGRTFLYWLDESTWEDYAPGDTILVTQDTTLTAVWTVTPDTAEGWAKAVADMPGSLVRALWQFLIAWLRSLLRL